MSWAEPVIRLIPPPKAPPVSTRFTPVPVIPPEVRAKVLAVGLPLSSTVTLDPGLPAELKVAWRVLAGDPGVPIVSL